MTKKLIVKNEIQIQATPEKVWEVLVTPKYVAQWDDLPENYPSEKMKEGSKVVWEHPNGGQVVTTVIRSLENKELKIALYSSNWEDEIKEGDIANVYQVEEQQDGITWLSIEIGDFSLLQNGVDYYKGSVEFASESKNIIKKLAESL